MTILFLDVRKELKIKFGETLRIPQAMTGKNVNRVAVHRTAEGMRDIWKKEKKREWRYALALIAIGGLGWMYYFQRNTIHILLSLASGTIGVIK